MEAHHLKICGMVAGVVVVVGVIGLLTLTPAGRLRTIGGTSADIGDVATGNVVVISRADYQQMLDQLKGYADADETTRTVIIQGVIHSLEGLTQ